MAEPEILAFVPSKSARREHGGARGWIKPRRAEGIAHHRVKLTFKKGPGSAPEVFLSFYIEACQLTKFRPDHAVFRTAPPGSFVFDSRYLIEHEGASHWRAQNNLKALDEAFAWWSKNKLGPQVTFFCYSGHNRSVTAAVFFACSALMKLLDGDDKWSIVGSIYRPEWPATARHAEVLENERAYLGDFEDFPNFVLALVSRIRPAAFHDTTEPLEKEMWLMTIALANAGARMAREIEKRLAEVEKRKPQDITGNDVLLKADPAGRIEAILLDAVEPRIKRPGKPPTPVKLLDYWTVWRGHDDNRQILRIIDSALRARMYEQWWIGQIWLDKELPPRLKDSRAGTEEVVTPPKKSKTVPRVSKRKTPGEAKLVDADDPITVL